MQLLMRLYFAVPKLKKLKIYMSASLITTLHILQLLTTLRLSVFT